MQVLDKLIAAGEDHQKAPQRAIRLPSLRQFLPGRHHVRRILRGLPVLAAMAWRAGRAGLKRAAAPPKPKQAKGDEKSKAPKDGEKKDDQKSVADGLERAGAALLGVIIVCTAAVGAAGPLWAEVQPYARTAVGMATVALLTAAWIVGPKSETAGESEPPVAGGEAQPDPALLPQDVAPLGIDPVAAAVRQLAIPRGWLGAHLDDVLALLPGRSRAELLEVLAEAGIPVEEQLKLTLPGGKKRNRQGIRLSVLPPAPDQPAAEASPEPPSAAAVEAPPEPAPPAVTLTVYGTE